MADIAARQPRDGHVARPTSGPAKTSSRPVSRSPTSSEPTSASCSPDRSDCSKTSTARSACGSWNGSRRTTAAMALGEAARGLAGPNGYSGRRRPAELYEHLAGAPRGVRATTATPENRHPRLHQSHQDPARRDRRARDPHRRTPRHPPRRVIFQSLPRSGTMRAATLLAEIGDCRARFPDPKSLACLAGVAPSTRQSGRHHAVTFRWSSDKKLRDALCDFAGDSWRANAWAEHRYRELRAAGKPTPTPNASSPEAGPTSSGDAGKTTPPTTPPATARTNNSAQAA